MPPLEPRSAGKLQVGSVIYDSRTQVFSVEMLFEAANRFSPDDEMRSAALAASRHFLMLLRQNGFHDHGPPETRTLPGSEPGRVIFYIACKAKKQKPAIIMIHDPDKVKKSNGDDAPEGRG